MEKKNREYREIEKRREKFLCMRKWWVKKLFLEENESDRGEKFKCLRENEAKKYEKYEEMREDTCTKRVRKNFVFEKKRKLECEI